MSNYKIWIILINKLLNYFIYVYINTITDHKWYLKKLKKIIFVFKFPGITIQSLLAEIIKYNKKWDIIYMDFAPI